MDGNHLSLGLLVDALHPVHDTASELVPFDAGESVRAENPAGQFHEIPEVFTLAFSEQPHFSPALAAAHNRADGYRDTLMAII